MSRAFQAGGYVFIGDQLTNLKTLNTYMNNTANNWSSYYDETGTAYTPSGSNSFFLKVLEVNQINSTGCQGEFGYAATSPGLNATSAPSTMQYFGHGSTGFILMPANTAGATSIKDVAWTVPNGNYLIIHDNVASQVATMAYGYEGTV